MEGDPGEPRAGAAEVEADLLIDGGRDGADQQSEQSRGRAASEDGSPAGPQRERQRSAQYACGMGPPRTVGKQPRAEVAAGGGPQAEGGTDTGQGQCGQQREDVVAGVGPYCGDPTQWGRPVATSGGVDGAADEVEHRQDGDREAGGGPAGPQELPGEPRDAREQQSEHDHLGTRERAADGVRAECGEPDGDDEARAHGARGGDREGGAQRCGPSEGGGAEHLRGAVLLVGPGVASDHDEGRQREEDDRDSLRAPEEETTDVGADHRADEEQLSGVGVDGGGQVCAGGVGRVGPEDPGADHDHQQRGQPVPGGGMDPLPAEGEPEHSRGAGQCAHRTGSVVVVVA